MPAPAPPTTAAGRYVRNLRKGLGDTQHQFANRVGVNQSTVSRTELGGDLSPEFAFRLVNKTDANWDDVAPLVSSALRPYLESLAIRQLAAA